MIKLYLLRVAPPGHHAHVGVVAGAAPGVGAGAQRGHRHLLHPLPRPLPRLGLHGEQSTRLLALALQLLQY